MMAGFLLAYGLHSTLLLAVAWSVTKVARPRSPIVRERLWKLAAVLPVLTASCVALSLRDRKAERESTVEVFLDSERVERSAVLSRSDRATTASEAAEPISRNALVSGLDSPLEPDASAFRLMDETPQDGDSTTYDPLVAASSIGVESTEPLAQTNVAVTAPRDEPFAIEHQIVIDRPRTEGSSRGAVRATIDWQPVWHVLSRMLCGWMWIGLAWLVLRSVLFRWRWRTARRLHHGRAAELLREFAVSKRVRLLIAPGFSEPAAFGIWRPTIVLPPSCESLPRDELRAVLAHELGHLARGDVWWLLMGRMLTTVFAFQPLNRIARREWTAAAECLCDSWAVDRGVERLTLARCLTALAEHRLTGVSLADALAAVGSPSSLRIRIERLVADPVVDPWSQRTRRWLLSGSVIAAALIVALVIPLPNVAPPPAIAAEPDAELISDIEAELDALRSDLQRAEQLALSSGDASAIDTLEQLRDRERHIGERLPGVLRLDAALHSRINNTRNHESTR